MDDVRSGRNRLGPWTSSVSAAGTRFDNGCLASVTAMKSLLGCAYRGAVIAYGVFINTVVEFFIVAFTIFLVVRQINKWRGPVEKKA